MLATLLAAVWRICVDTFIACTFAASSRSAACCSSAFRYRSIFLIENHLILILRTPNCSQKQQPEDLVSFNRVKTAKQTGFYARKQVASVRQMALTRSPGIPYDVLLGFSQGTIVTTLLTAAWLKRGEAPTWRGNVLVCGIPPRCNTWRARLPKPLA